MVRQFKAPLKPQTPSEFVEKWTPRIRAEHDGAVEIDFSFVHQSVMVHDMRTPSSIRAGNLATAKEIAEGISNRPGEILARVNAFLAAGAKHGGV